ncbi:penicillin-binding protein activator LpoB [Spirochaeta cellobiosiphila]|uniref:penicillin-binding protein activator LpoB n=1 Tax=Spirochaeta cellobiosiphila TaxID=504483 RepID=UPI000420B574|nr:penicillin-binding protein activator LpoB [Spirochaeta cellobiosiphila]
MKKLFLLLILPAFIMSCNSTSRTVQRTSADTVTDLSGRWNDTDSRLVAEEMVSDSLSFPWVNDFATQEGRKPVVIVGSISNRSSEHIDTRVFTKDIERELIKSGTVKFVASSDERLQLRDEKTDQQSQSSLDTMKRIGQETGADFMLIGNISSITDAIDNRKVVFYQVDMELINIETNEKVWIGSKEIKKEIEQRKSKF